MTTLIGLLILAAAAGFLLGVLYCQRRDGRRTIRQDNRDRRAQWAWMYFSCNEAHPNSWNWKWREIERHGTGLET